MIVSKDVVKNFIFCIFVLLLGLLVFGCGDDDDASASTDTDTDTDSDSDTDSDTEPPPGCEGVAPPNVEIQWRRFSSYAVSFMTSIS